jgi:shikimate dehydrogenase
MISSETKICGLIGDPIEHSVSPAMHNTAFSYLGLDYIYIPLHVERENLTKAIDGLKALNIKGLNITIPYKVVIIPLLDLVDDLAEKIGSVNTIVNDKGYLKGYNTDASGFLKTLLERGFEPRGKKVVVLGAGGASRSISFTLAMREAEIVILNRQLEMDWAVELVSSISQLTTKEVKALELNNENLKSVLKAADMLVNATSVGMSPNINQSPLPARLLKPELVVFDVVYNPLKTRLLTEAEAVGAKTISGIDMLVWQGALAFELWTGVKSPVDIMKAKALEALKA